MKGTNPIVRLRRLLYKKKNNHFMPHQYDNAELGNLAFGHSRGEYAVDRDEFQELFYAFLDRNDFDAYGHHFDLNKGQVPYDEEDHSTFKNGTFIIRPYYWGDNLRIQKLPNFHYLPTDLQIHWYKYALRDSYSNREFTKGEFIKILKDCEDSMYAVHQSDIDGQGV